MSDTRAVDALPPLSEATLDILYRLKGASGVADTFYVARKSTTGVIAWERVVGASELHTAVTVTDSTSIDLTLATQVLSAAAIFGTGAGVVAEGNHTHAQLHDAVTVADTASVDLTLTGQQVSAAAIFGSSGTTVAAGNHTHAQLHDAMTVVDTAGIDLALSGQQLTATPLFGSTAGTVAQGSDTRFHNPVTVTDTASIDLTLATQVLSAAAIFGTGAGVVAEGNHTHSYVPTTSGAGIIFFDDDTTNLAFNTVSTTYVTTGYAWAPVLPTGTWKVQVRIAATVWNSTAGAGCDIQVVIGGTAGTGAGSTSQTNNARAPANAISTKTGVAAGAVTIGCNLKASANTANIGYVVASLIAYRTA